MIDACAFIVLYQPIDNKPATKAVQGVADPLRLPDPAPQREQDRLTCRACRGAGPNQHLRFATGPRHLARSSSWDSGPTSPGGWCSRLVVLFIVSIGTFALAHAVPGDPLNAVIGERQADRPEVRQRLEQRYGLDKPLPVQYVYYVRNLLHGDLGDDDHDPQTGDRGTAPISSRQRSS